MVSRIRRLLVIPIIALMSVLSACTASNDDRAPDTSESWIDRAPEHRSTLSGELAALGFQCVPRDGGAETPTAARCAYADDQTFQRISFATNSDGVAAWMLLVRWHDDTPTDPAAVEAVVRPTLEKLAGVDADQAVEVAVATADQGPGPAVTGQAFQIGAVDAILGIQLGGVGLTAQPDFLAVDEATQVSATELDLGVLDQGMTDRSAECFMVNDPGLDTLSCGAARLSITTSAGRLNALSASLRVDDPYQVAALASAIEALNLATQDAPQDVDFAVLLGGPVEVGVRSVRVSGDLLVLARGYSGPEVTGLDGNWVDFLAV